MSDTTGWSKGMKVINTWDGEPAQTPTQIIREWYAEHHRDIANYGIAGPPVDALMSALAPLFAAGPWHYDVENAPKEVLLLCWQWTPERCDWNQIIMRRHEDGTWECGDLLCEHDPPIAFATINRPETNNDHP